MLLARYIKKRKNKKKRLEAVDRLMMVVALLHPLSGLPQIIDIYVNQNVAGVSILTWIGFMSFGSIYLYYGILHKLKPVILTQILWMIVDVMVIIGVLIFR